MTSTGLAQITVDDRFFEVAAAQSSRYPPLWTIAKETIQNSQDAHASKIEFDVTSSSVTITDDGPGMKPTGGIANFLRLGASEKNLNGSATGFFSTAKVRICFIHDDWTIWTNDEYLDKSMLNREPIARSNDTINGCRIWVKGKRLWSSDDVSDYVALCNPDISVDLNGRKLKRTYRRGTLKANFDWADVYVNRGKKALLGYLVVRVNGLAMFTRSLPGVRAQVTVELDPKRSHIVLQENREGLVWSAKDGDQTIYPESQLNRFVEGLIVNPRSAQPKDKTVLEFVSGSQRALHTRKAKFDDTGAEAAWSHATQQVEVRGQLPRELTIAEIANLLKEGFAYVSKGEGAPIEMLDGTYKWRTTKGTETRYSDNVPEGLEIAVYTGPEDIGSIAGGHGEVTTAPEETGPNSPANFREIFPYDYIVKHEGKRPRPHTKHARLLKAWAGICKKIAEVNSISTDFGVGLLVQQEAKAEFLDTSHGEFLCIDYLHVKATGSQLAETLKLIALACHELTHAKGYDDHNERFIIQESEIYETALEHLTDVRREAKGLTIYSRGYGQSD